MSTPGAASTRRFSTSSVVVWSDVTEAYRGTGLREAATAAPRSPWAVDVVSAGLLEEGGLEVPPVQGDVVLCREQTVDLRGRCVDLVRERPDQVPAALPVHLLHLVD